MNRGIPESEFQQRRAYWQKRAFRNKARQDMSPQSPLTPKEPMTQHTDIARAPQPVAGELLIKGLATKLGVGLREVAAAGRIGASTLHQIVNLNQWPKRQVVRCDQILELLRKKGATQIELDSAFDLVPQTAPHPEAKANAASHPDYEPVETDMLMGKQSLSMAARKHFGLYTNPFDGLVQSDKEMFLSGEIRFIRQAAWQCAVNGAFVAIMGESGAGKTTILNDLKERVLNSTESIITIEPSVLGMEASDKVGKTLKAADVLMAAISTLDPSATVRQSIEGRTSQLVKLINGSAQAGNHHLLVIEEAHSLSKPTLRHLKRLQEKTAVGRRNTVGILLLAHPELRKILNANAHDVREVYQRCEMLDLMPLDGDLPNYLRHRAELADKKLGELITDDGVDEVRARLTVERHDYSGKGVKQVSLVYPLAVNNLVTAALNRAAELGIPQVNKDIVRSLRA